VNEMSMLSNSLLMTSVEQVEILVSLLPTTPRSLALYLRRIWRAIVDLHPSASLRSLLKRLNVGFECAVAHRSLRSWHAHSSVPPYALMVERHPLLPARSGQPYLNALWSLDERMRVLKTHYGLLTQARVLAFPLDASVVLASLDDIEPELKLVLDKPKWFANEGEVALNLFSGGERLYSLLFTLGEVDGKRVAYVGALQGSSVVDAVDRYRNITRAAHGMRPRDLLFTAFRMLCLELGVERILAVSDRANVIRSGYFQNVTMMFANLDDIWVEYGGVLGEDGFFEISPQLRLRELDEIPSRKRAMYRRRYDMLHSMQARVASGVHTFEYQKLACTTPLAPRRSHANATQQAPGVVARLRRKHLKSRILSPLDEYWDRRLGVRTFGFIPPVGEHGAPNWRAHYVSNRYATLLQYLRQAEIGPDDVFIDYGCGLGRVVFLANWLGARRSIGVEIDATLYEGAEANRRACRHRAANIEFVCQPAETYRPVDASVIYLFHPFGPGTLQSVLDNLEADLAERPRRARLIYTNPVHADVIDAMPRWRRSGTIPAGSRFLRPYSTYYWEWS
jgi:uncharacterized protein VirK/YbjX